jgi:hypothetical protein
MRVYLRDKAGQIFGDSIIDLWAVHSKAILRCEHTLLWLCLKQRINCVYKKPFTNTELPGDVLAYDLQRGVKKAA